MNQKLLLLSLFALASFSLADNDCSWISKLKIQGRYPTYMEEQITGCLFEAMENKSVDAFKNSNPFIQGGFNYELLEDKGFNPMKLPPLMNYNTRENVKVNIHDAEIRQATPDASAGTTSLEGYFHMKWKDERLAYSKQTYKLPYVTLTPSLVERMWYPLFTVDRKTGRGSTQASELIIPKLWPDGTVEASVFLDWTANCEFNTRDYPYDTTTCSAFFVGSWANDTASPIEITFEGTVRKALMWHGSQYWHFREATIEPKTNRRRTTALEYRVKLARVNGSADTEIVIPILIATILAMIAPLFGNFKWQAIIKVIALLLMYISLLNFVQNHWYVKYAGAVPKLLDFHKFSMITTTVTIILTLMLWSFSRKTPGLPPPQWLTNITSKLSSACFCTNVDEKSDESATVDGGATREDSWGKIMNALNCMCFFTFLIIYIIGTIYYCS